MFQRAFTSSFFLKFLSSVVFSFLLSSSAFSSFEVPNLIRAFGFKDTAKIVMSSKGRAFIYERSQGAENPEMRGRFLNDGRFWYPDIYYGPFVNGAWAHNKILELQREYELFLIPGYKMVPSFRSRENLLDGKYYDFLTFGIYEKRDPTPGELSPEKIEVNLKVLGILERQENE